ncbi:MAG TPA: hypothetical protein VFA09_00820 [Ktedonobacteraceae bacterium]|jgi:hypothetical protein|nr:hypothetical protein [Ktedonobacteraceae bacterium]
MITQAIKNWLRGLFAWWPWKKSPQITYTPAISPLNKGLSQGSASRSAIDGFAPQAGITPRLSTVEEWPERVVQPQTYFPDASTHPERPLLPAPPPSPSNEQPEKKQAGDHKDTPLHESPPAAKEPARPIPPTPEQQLEFLQYLVKRGIVNEGFDEGKEPEQYRRNK